MTKELIYKLQIITLLDSICFGLTYPFLSTYIQTLGADHVVVGVLSVGYLLVNLISTDFVHLMTNYERRLSMVLFITLLSHLSLIVTSNYWFIIFGRYIYSIVANHCQNFCKNLLAQNTAVINKREYILTIFSLLSGAGYIIGPILAGHLYSKGFLYIGLLAALLTFTNVCLAISISDDSTSESDSDKSSISERVYCSIIDVLDDCQKCHYERNWDVMAIKFLYVSSVMIFYGKFSQILKNNFNSSPFAVGCTYAYMNSLTFTSSYFATVVKDRYTPFSPIILAERSFKLLGACLLVTCYSPTYILYMIMCAPVVFLNTFIDCIWEELLTTRNEDSLSKLNQNIKIAAGLTTPIIFGVFCNMIGHHAVIIFSVIPVIMSIYIINKYTKHYNFFEVEKKNE